MPVQLDDFAIGPVRLGLLPHAGGRGEPAARAWLAGRLGVDAERLVLERDLHGRPELGQPRYDCSWSHSGAHLLVALAGDARVGVDIEVHRPRPRAVEIARRYFHPREAEALAVLPEAMRGAAFLRLWCAKEALLKAHGRGLAHGLDRFEIAGFESPPGALRIVDDDGGLGLDWQLAELDCAGATAILAWRSTAGA
jgi:4'-phosphopantetheinyl transferase